VPNSDIKTVLDAGIVAGAGGGIEKTLVLGARHHAGTRYRSVIALVHPLADESFERLRARALDHDVRLLDRAEAFPFSPLTLAWFAGICRRERVAIWHGHDYKTDLIGLLLRPLFGFALVSTLHGWSERSRRTRLYFAVDRLAIRRYDEVIAVSSELYAAAQRLHIPARRLSLIENGVDTEQYRRDPRDDRASDPSRRLRVGGAGRLTPEKGFIDLLAAVETLLDEGLDLELEIAGEGPQRAELEDRIRRSKHRSRLALRGYVADMREFYSGLDIFCMTSLREGLPNVVLEAMAMSLAIVSTSAGGLATFLRDRSDALLCAPGSVPALSEALRALARSPELRGRLAAAARERVVAQCSFADRMRKLFSVYDRLG
jgi:glycosyltransferase involved in cell wall biosynthesis